MKGGLRRAGWAVTCAALAVVLQSFFRQPVSLQLLCGVGVFTAVAAVRPAGALLLLAGFGPLATIIFNLARGSAGSVQFGETLVLAFLSGWTAYMTWSGERLKAAPIVRLTTMLLAAAAVGSALVGWAGIRAELQTEQTRELLQWYVLHDYPLRPPGGEPLSAAVVFTCGLLLVVAASHLCAGRPELRVSALRMMVCGAAAAAGLNLLRIVLAALEREDVLAALRLYAASFRVNVHYADLNAAGSYFALTVLLAAGLYARNRWLAALATPVIAAGLWLTGSRFALAAVFVVLCGLAFAGWRRAASRTGRTAVVLALAIIVCTAVVMSVRYPAGRNEAAWSAFRFRVDLARAGLQMAAERPLTGVGLGRFYRLSSDYAPAALARLGFVRENAHNQFVQILAELGVPGLLCFLLLTAFACRQLLRSETPLPPHLIGLAAGIGAFLLTCLGGHPLVVPDTAYVFFLALGFAAAPMGPTPVKAVGVKWRMAALAVVVIIAASIPWRSVRAAREADVGSVSAGLSAWQRDADGTRYRWAGTRATFHRPASDRSITIPLRYGSETTGPLEVRIFVDGQEADRVRLEPDEGWKTVRLVFHRRPVARYRRIDLVGGPVDSAVTVDITPRPGGGLFRIGRSADE